MLLAGFIIGALGVLNDVTITQASATSSWPQPVSRRAWRRSGRRCASGRDHIASTVYTLVFAYAGSALPLLLLFSVASQPFGSLLTTDQVAMVSLARVRIRGRHRHCAVGPAHHRGRRVTGDDHRPHPLDAPAERRPLVDADRCAARGSPGPRDEVAVLVGDEVAHHAHDHRHQFLRAQSGSAEQWHRLRHGQHRSQPTAAENANA